MENGLPLPTPPPAQPLTPPPAIARAVIEKLLLFSDDFMGRVFPPPPPQIMPPPPPPPITEIKQKYIEQYTKIQQKIQEYTDDVKNNYNDNELYIINRIFSPEFKEEFIALLNEKLDKFVKGTTATLQQYIDDVSQQNVENLDEFVKINNARIAEINNTINQFVEIIVEMFKGIRGQYIMKLGQLRELAAAQIPPETPVPPELPPQPAAQNVSQIPTKIPISEEPRDFPSLRNFYPNSSSEISYTQPYISQSETPSFPELPDIYPTNETIEGEIQPLKTQTPETTQPTELDNPVQAELREKPVEREIVLGEPNIQKLLQFSAKLIQHIAPQPEPMAPQLEPNEEDISVAATSHKKPVSRDIVLGEPNIQKLLQFSAKLIQNITPPQSSVARDLVLGEPNIQKLLQFSAKLIQHIKPLSEETVAREPNLQKLLQFSAKLIQHIIEKQKPTKQITQQPSVAREIVLVEPNIQKLLQFSAKLIQHIIEKQSVAQIPAAPKVPVLSSAKVVPLEGVVVFDVNKLLLFSNRLLKQIIKPATAAKPAGESSGWFGLFGRNQPPTAKDVKQDEIRKPEYTINKDQLEEAPQTTSQEEAQITVLDNKPKIDLSSTEGMHVGIFDTNYDIQGKEEYEIKNENGREVLYRKSVGNMAVGDVATATPISDEFITDQSISV